MNAIETYKLQGAAVSLENQLNLRIHKLADASKERNWVLCYSLGHWVQELSEELRKLDDANVKKPVPNTSGE
jgi:hypothetical protein